MAKKPDPPPVATPRTKPRSYAGTRDDTLVVVVSSHAGVATVPLRRGARVTLGRAPECDVVIDDDGVSRQHASLEAARDRIFVEDAGSTNGTLVGGRCLTRGERGELAIGEPFAVGAATVYVLGEKPLAPATGGSPSRVVHDPAMVAVYALLDKIAPSPLSVLILGETGVGKEVFAEAIHERSPRASNRLLKLNCAALPESILEAELFGHEKGAFTGATAAKQGLFEAANGGTVMLDEIGELPLASQTKLLRVLETGEVLRLGSTTTASVDVRFIAATNVDLRARVAEGKFRSDLYFRLDGISVTLPPLRDRPGDVVPLARMFIARFAERLRRPVPQLAAGALELLERHRWPGNVRELRNVVERAVILSSGPSIEPAHLTSIATVEPAGSGALRDDLDKIERARIIRTLEEAAGNQTRAAKLLGISRHMLLDRLDRYGIARPRKR